MNTASVVIAGAGQAGFQLAASLRQAGYQGDITLIGDEAGLPYERPPLSKGFLLREVTVDNIQFRPSAYFEQHRIQLVHGRVQAIDRGRRHTVMSDGKRIPYDHLVLALGSRNRPLPVPGADGAGVYGVRTLQDADALANCLVAGRKLVVVGAGFIGLEVAAVAVARGLAVHVVELADRPMARAVSVETSRFFADAHRASGVDFSLGAGVEKVWSNDSGVESVELSGGQRLAADLVVVGVGVVPNVEVARQADLVIGDGICVDHNLLTSDPSISAVGDCASFTSPYASTRIRLESVQNAVDQARCVAARLAGKPSPFNAVPWFWSDQGSHKLQIVGLRNDCDHTVTVGTPQDGHFSVLCFRQQRLIAVESVNQAGDHMAARRILARGSALSPADATNSGFDLRGWEARTR